ncbi:MAG: hypothetical protein AB7Y46_13095 [Armatimonadota bacterium]
MRTQGWTILATIVLGAGAMAAAVAEQAPEVTNLRQELRQEADVLAARMEFGRQAGFTDEQMRLILGTKFHLHRLQLRLTSDLEALAVALLDEAEPDEVKAAAVAEYLQRREQTLRAMEDVQQRLIAQVGAEDDPLKMGALIVFGVVDSGRRVTCAVHSEISGGGSGGIRREEMGRGLQQPLGR